MPWFIGGSRRTAPRANRAVRAPLVGCSRRIALMSTEAELALAVPSPETQYWIVLFSVQIAPFASLNGHPCRTGAAAQLRGAGLNNSGAGGRKRPCSVVLKTEPQGFRRGRRSYLQIRGLAVQVTAEPRR